jgi:hypothetical protein
MIGASEAEIQLPSGICSAEIRTLAAPCPFLQECELSPVNGRSLLAAAKDAFVVAVA